MNDIKQLIERNRRYFEYFKSYVKYEIKICVLLILSSIIGLISPLLYQIIIDNVLIANQIYLLKYVIIIMIFFYIWSFAINFVVGSLSTYLNQIISIRLRSDIMNHILKMRMEEITESRIGDFIAKISEDVATVTSFISGNFVSVTSDTFNVLAVGTLMVIYNKKLAIATFLLCICQLCTAKFFSKPIRNIELELREKSSLNLSFLNNVFSTLKYSKAYNKEKHFQREYVRVLKMLKNVSFKSFFVQYSYGIITSMVSYVGSIVILILGITEIKKGNMTIGILFVFDTLTNSFCQFANKLVDLTVLLQSSFVAFERINSIFDTPIEAHQKRQILTSYDIVFKDVQFSYKEHSVFDGLNLELKQGHSYAILGPTGSGKSTLAYLVLGFYEINAGDICIGKKDLNEVGIVELRKNITLVLQDSMIIMGTIEENIRYGNKKATLNEIKKVAYIAGIDDFIEADSMGYNMLIEENGSNLSGGQKQRLCLARALLRDTPIYIFDESFSAIDAKTSSIVFKRIEEYLKHKTRIYITHNYELAKEIPEIIMIKDGIAYEVNMDALNFD